MTGKRLGLTAVLLGLLLNTGCCGLARRWCDPPVGAVGYAPAAAPAYCCQPVSCQPACPPGTAPVPAVPTAQPGGWSRPAYSMAPNGCCPQ